MASAVFALTIFKDDREIVFKTVRKISLKQTWEDVCLEYLDLKGMPQCDCVDCCVVNVSSTSNSAEVFYPEFDDAVDTLYQFNHKLNTVTIKLKCETCPLNENQQRQKAEPTKCAFHAMMSSQTEKKPAKENSLLTLVYTYFPFNK